MDQGHWQYYLNRWPWRNQFQNLSMVKKQRKNWLMKNLRRFWELCTFDNEQQFQSAFLLPFRGKEPAKIRKVPGESELPARANLKEFGKPVTATVKKIQDYFFFFVSWESFLSSELTPPEFLPSEDSALNVLWHSQKFWQ